MFRGTPFTLLNFGNDNLPQLNKIAETQRQILRLCIIGANASETVFPGMCLTDMGRLPRYVGEVAFF